MTGQSNIICREYAKEDRDACIAIFKSLTPHYFKAGEMKEFADFLDRVDHDRTRYVVIENANKKIIACGGVMIDRQNGVASLCWEMVHQEHQRQGIGSFMLQARLGWLRDYPELTHVIASASAHSAKFFEKEGFETFHVQKDYFGNGLDLLDMKYRLR
ncbi:GNAT family N-acetyltransferase [Candidatus Sumerlaeota bacterium]|nr:GNAT family N-acetyltransferase [Candidatus Sumerlaeota bacterium]MBI3736162.1 GNAT family N-acetyltransferase [Candidatus Sumerlaeota bacterium]